MCLGWHPSLPGSETVCELARSSSPVLLPVLVFSSPLNFGCCTSVSRPRPAVPNVDLEKTQAAEL